MTTLLKETLPYFLLISTHRSNKYNLRKDFENSVAVVVYICVMLKVLSKCFSRFSQAGIVSQKDQKIWPQTCTTLSQHSIPALKNWENK